MSDPTPQTINPALVPLDWNFYATDSSVIFKLEPSPLQPYWVEAHAHFGRFNSLPLSITLTSHKQGLEDGTALLERILKELLQRRLPAFFNRSGPPAGLELQPSIYYFGIHVQMDAIAFSDPLIKHIPRRARAQVEKVLSVIPPDDLTNTAEAIQPPASAPESIPEPTPTQKPEPIATSGTPTEPVATQAVEPTTQPRKTAKKRAKPAAKRNSAPSPGFTQATPAASTPPIPERQVIQPSLVSIAAPAESTATAIMTAPVPVAAGASWDWEEDDDDIVF